MRERPRAAGRTIVALSAGLLGAGPAPALVPTRLLVLDTAAFQAPGLVESSGAALSSLVPGVVWTHNDSGDGPYLYATDVSGRDRGRLRVAEAHNTDWEDLAAGPCFVAPGRCLYAGDIGDNRRRRAQIVVYRVREPQPPSSAADTLRTVPLLDSIVLRYPDHPHDAEALVVTGDGALLLITKDRGGPPLLFRASAAAGPPRRGLDAAGTLDIETSLLTGRLVTGASLAPGDSLLVVRTYVSVHFFRLRPGSAPVRLGTPAGLTIPVVEPQGEGVTFDGPDRLILTSERGQAGRGTIVRLEIVGQQAPKGGRTH